jgi:hypothetical protein
MRIISSSSTTRIRLACVAGRSVAMIHPSAGTGTHPDRIGLTMHCGCPRALGFARQGTAWAGPALNALAPGGVPPAPQPLTPSGRETLAPINARVFSCALSKRKWASWRLHKGRRLPHEALLLIAERALAMAARFIRSHAGDANSRRTSPPIFQGVSFDRGTAAC